MRYLDVGTYDSDNPARLSFGEFSSSGVYDELDVTIEEPRLTISADDPSRISGNITLVTTRVFADLVSTEQDDR
jgi:hypothetical protein